MSALASGCVVLVWFRADPARNEACREALAALTGRAAAAHGVRARFGWRDEPDGRHRTWLESYEPLAPDRCAAFVEALGVDARALGLDALVTGKRYVDVFEWSA